MPVDDEPIAARGLGAGREAAHDRQPGALVLEQGEEGVGGKRERVGQHQEGGGALGFHLGPARQGVSVGCRGEPEVKRRDGAGAPGPQGHGRRLLDLAAAADHRLGDAAEHGPRAQSGRDRGSGVLDRSPVWWCHEEEGEIGRGVAAESLQHLADGLAHGVGGDRVLGQAGGEVHQSTGAGMSVRGTIVVWPPSMRQWASIVP